MHLAYVEPVIGLNNYGRELLPHLACYGQVDVVTDGNRKRLSADIAAGFKMLGYEDLPARRADYDHILFHLRNNGDSVPTHDLLLSVGGVAVMHEITLLGIVGAKTLRRGRRLAFLRSMVANEGTLAGLAAGLDLFFRQRPPVRPHWLANRDVIRHSEGVIVHNRHAAERLRRRYPTLPIQIVSRGVPLPPPYQQQALKQELGLEDRFPVIASFGVVHARKRIGQALQAFAQLTRHFPEAIYVLVGPKSGFDLAGIVENLGLTNHVLALGRVDDETFHRYLAATDIGVNLRYPSEGETSSTALRLMSYGKPILVTNAGSLAELPDSCTIKVDPGPDEVAQIQHTMLNLARHRALRREMGAAALAYVKRHHTWQQAAQTYHEFLEHLTSTKGERSGQ